MDMTLRVWDLNTGAPLGVIRTGDVATCAMAVGELCKRLIAVSGGGEFGALRVWDLATGAPLGELLGRWRAMGSRSQSPAGLTGRCACGT
jgi:hypothetical protein